MLHPVDNLHGCVQIATAQAIIDDRPDWVALDLAVLLPRHRVKAPFVPSAQFGYIGHPGVTALAIWSLLL